MRLASLAFLLLARGLDAQSNSQLACDALEECDACTFVKSGGPNAGDSVTGHCTSTGRCSTTQVCDDDTTADDAAAGPAPAPPPPTPKPTPMPTDDVSCPATCVGSRTCDEVGMTCVQAESALGCDCGGCACDDDDGDDDDDDDGGAPAPAPPAAVPAPTSLPVPAPTILPTALPVPSPTALPVPAPTISVAPTPLTWPPTISNKPTHAPIPAPTKIPTPAGDDYSYDYDDDDDDDGTGGAVICNYDIQVTMAGIDCDGFGYAEATHFRFAMARVLRVASYRVGEPTCSVGPLSYDHGAHAATTVLIDVKVGLMRPQRYCINHGGSFTHDVADMDDDVVSSLESDLAAEIASELPDDYDGALTDTIITAAAAEVLNMPTSEPTASPAIRPAQSSKKSGDTGDDAGAIVGTVFGVLIGICMIGAAGYAFLHKEDLGLVKDSATRHDTLKSSKMFNTKTDPVDDDAAGADDWQALTDDTTGKVYWWNKRTNVTTWEQPASVRALTQRALPAVPQSLRALPVESSSSDDVEEGGTNPMQQKPKKPPGKPPGKPSKPPGKPGKPPGAPVPGAEFDEVEEEGDGVVISDAPKETDVDISSAPTNKREGSRRAPPSVEDTPDADAPAPGQALV